MKILTQSLKFFKKQCNWCAKRDDLVKYSKKNRKSKGGDETRTNITYRSYKYGIYWIIVIVKYK